MGLFGPKRDPKRVGEHSEQVIIARLMAAGYSVLVPVGVSIIGMTSLLKMLIGNSGECNVKRQG